MPTGVALALPDGYVALVHPRSGLAARHGLSIVNTPGTIDAGYRGEIKVLLINHDPHEPVELRRGDRIAQLVVQRFERAALRRGRPNCPTRRAAPGDTVLPEASAPPPADRDRRPADPPGRTPVKFRRKAAEPDDEPIEALDEPTRPTTRPAATGALTGGPVRRRGRRRHRRPGRPRRAAAPAGRGHRAPAPGRRGVRQRPVGDVRRTRGRAGAAGVRRAAPRRPVERGAAPDRRRPGPSGRHRHRARGPVRHRAGLSDARRATRRHDGLQPSRVIGINGSRWLLRATLLGRPAVEPGPASRSRRR